MGAAQQMFGPSYFVRALLLLQPIYVCEDVFILFVRCSKTTLLRSILVWMPKKVSNGGKIQMVKLVNGYCN